jgi:PAS domain S-box-containing protein
MMRKILKPKEKKRPAPSPTPMTEESEDILCHLAFHNSLQANLMFVASSGKIVMTNKAAWKLLGYSRKELLSRNAHDIFEIGEGGFKDLYKKGLPMGGFKEVLTVLKKNGQKLTCKITSASFLGSRNIKKTIATLENMSKGGQSQQSHDQEKHQSLIAAIASVQASSDAAFIRLGDLEHELDNELTLNQQLKSSSRRQKISFRKELDEKIGLEIRLKENQIAEAIVDAKELERADIGKELHDNVNQLLGATRLYLDMARKDDANREMYLNRSSEYTLSAIEEIRKLTKGLTADAIKNFGLLEAIRNICKDTMEVNPIKISYKLDLLIENKVNDKFKLNIYRIMQEQLTNILKHAKATKVAISLSQNKKFLLLSIADNGVGFDTGTRKKGIGITNIKSRSESYNGKADFVSKPGQGCVLNVRFPLKQAVLNQL